jgi:hypothetical protein
MYSCIIRDFELSGFYIAVNTPVSQGTVYMALLLLLSDVQNIKKQQFKIYTCFYIFISCKIYNYLMMTL